MGVIHRLTALAVQSRSPGKYADGAGLWLVKSEPKKAKWVLRLTIHGKRREMGLGGTASVSLKQARELAAFWRSVAADGKDPIRERAASVRAAARMDSTLATVTADAFEARKAELKGDGDAGRWLSPVTLHILPKLGRMPVDELDATLIRDTLAPIWHEKAETARKAMNRLSLILRHAAALGVEVDLQATDKAAALLGKHRHKTTNIPALPWQEVPAFYTSLDEPSPTYLALRLLILTGVRSGPLRNMRLDCVEGGVWTIPGEEMKGARDRTSDFRVPLSAEARRVIELASSFTSDGHLFRSARGGIMSDATMSRMMERRGMTARPHGFRTSLRVWLAETTDAPHEVAETVLAHTVGTAVSRAYQRSDFLEQRRALMERWAAFVTGADATRNTSTKMGPV